MIRVFFIFHYEKELWRAQIVKQTWLSQGGEALDFWDKATWHQARSNERHLELIDTAIDNAHVTAVLIAQGTSDQGYVQYAVRKSHQKCKGLLAIYFHNIPDEQGSKAPIGNARFGDIDQGTGSGRAFFWQLYPTHRWIIEDGPRNLKQWIAEAAAASNLRAASERARH